MKIERWGIVAEVVSAIAIVLSLIFVGVQVKQNSDAQTQTGTQAVISGYNDGGRVLAMDPEMACIFLRGALDHSSLSGVERVRFSAFFLGMFNVQQQIHHLRQSGDVDEDIGAGLGAQLKDIVRLPGVYEWFQTRDHWYSRDFREYVDALRAEPASENYALLLVPDPACTPSTAATSQARSQ